MADTTPGRSALPRRTTTPGRSALPRKRGDPQRRTTAPVTLVLDVGGTKIAAGLVDADGTLVHRAQQPTPDGDAETVWAVGRR